MSKATPKKDFISADQLLTDSFRLGLKILEDNFHPQFIVGVWRGGTPIGVAVQELLAHCEFPSDHIAIRTSSYYAIGQQSKEVRVHGLGYLVEHCNADDGLLIVDDVYDSGLSIKAIMDALRTRMRLNCPRDIRVATVYYKPTNNKTDLEPHYYIHTTKKWLVFPHEMQGLTPEEIKSGKGPLYDIIQKANGYAAAREKRDGEKKTPALPDRQRIVCITGASGFLGSWVLKLCLERGWTVHATTRSIQKHGNRLKSLVPAATEQKRLRIFECDLLKENSFIPAMTGCDALIHTASPFFTVGGSMDNLVRPALQGTTNVLNVANRQKIRDVVLTSSTAAVYATYGKYDETHVFTEDDWSDMDKMIEAKNYYCMSKMKAEKKAWELAAKFGMNLAVMNPCLIFGPMLQPTLNTSSNAICKLFNGTTTEIPNATKSIVDVRDVAQAHCRALDSGTSPWGKRHLLIGACPKYTEIAASVRSALPLDKQANVPTVISETIQPPSLGAPAPHTTRFDVSRATKELGITFRGTDDMVRETVRSLIEWGLADSL